MAEPLFCIYTLPMEGVVARKTNYQQEKRRRELEKQKKKDLKKERKQNQQDSGNINEDNGERSDTPIE